LKPDFETKAMQGATAMTFKKYQSKMKVLNPLFEGLTKSNSPEITKFTGKSLAQGIARVFKENLLDLGMDATPSNFFYFLLGALEFNFKNTYNLKISHIDDRIETKNFIRVLISSETDKFLPVIYTVSDGTLQNDHLATMELEKQPIIDLLNSKRDHAIEINIDIQNHKKFGYGNTIFTYLAHERKITRKDTIIERLLKLANPDLSDETITKVISDELSILKHYETAVNYDKIDNYLVELFLGKIISKISSTPEDFQAFWINVENFQGSPSMIIKSEHYPDLALVLTITRVPDFEDVTNKVNYVEIPQSLNVNKILLIKIDANIPRALDFFPGQKYNTFFYNKLKAAMVTADQIMRKPDADYVDINQIVRNNMATINDKNRYQESLKIIKKIYREITGGNPLKSSENLALIAGYFSEKENARLEFGNGGLKVFFNGEVGEVNGHLHCT